jgi:hypothetical protein
VNLYNLLLALPQANIGEQIVDFVKGLIKGDGLLSTDHRTSDLLQGNKNDQHHE